MGILSRSRGSATGTSDTGLPGPVPTTVVSRTQDPGSKEASERPEGAQGAFGRTFSSMEEEARHREKRERAGREQEKTQLDPYLDMSRLQRRKAQREATRLGGTFDAHPHLLALKPREKYVFRSDYIEVDGGFATMLGFFHDEAAHDDFGFFWGINRIPAGLDDSVGTVLFEQVRVMGEKWVSDRTKVAEKLDRLGEGEQAETGSATSRRKAAKISDDMAVVAGEIQDGASYLHVHSRLLVKAPTLELLDDSVERITRLYIDRFGTLRVAPYHGEQRQELSNALGKNEVKRGKGFHFTSTEFAGAHSLVTNGLNDPSGEYVGYMVGDVNNSAVLFDVDGYEHHVVIADATLNPVLNRAHVPDMWGSKVAQAALLANRKVVHIVLDGADLDALGPRLDSITSRLDMSNGDINMFEMFGDEAEELSIFPSHLEKLVLMVEQAYETTEKDRSIIRGALKDILTQFYVDQNMWHLNAKQNRDRLRMVNLPHDQVPRLEDIYTSFQTRYAAEVAKSAKDNEMVSAYNVLRLVFKDLLDNNGDLFNTHTNPEIDRVGESSRVVYNFSRLLRRGKGVAMAQLVNVIGFAVGSLAEGDVVIVHGTEAIDSRVKEYITTQLQHLFGRGGRVVYLYNDVDAMLADERFNNFDAADWTVLGPMREPVVARYQQQLHREIPKDLERLVTTRGGNLVYLRRGHTNVVFHLDLALGINPHRVARRAQILAEGGMSSAFGAPGLPVVGPEVVQSSAVATARGERAAQRERDAETGGAGPALAKNLAVAHEQRLDRRGKQVVPGGTRTTRGVRR